MPIALFGQAQPPSLSAARLHASVEIDSRGVFVYRYTLENGAGSNAGISKVTIDISLPAGASAPSAIGLAHGPGYFTESATRSFKAADSVPVGLSAPQPGWRTTVGPDATARWVAAQDKSLVFPKQKLTGFSMASPGPPSLRRFSLAPYVDPDLAPVEEPAPDALEQERYSQEFDQYVESRSVMGMTLAPTAPVTPVTADALLANLASQVVQARSLRWITSDAITRDLTDKLQAARAAVLRRQLEPAGNILRALRKEVAVQSGKTLSIEAVALVDLNIQYTIPLVAKP